VLFYQVCADTINQSINQFHSGDVAHTRTRETDEQTEAADRKNSTTQKNILKTCGERLKRQTHKTR